MGSKAFGLCFIQQLLDIEQDRVIVVSEVPVDSGSFGTALNHRPDIGLPGQLVLGERTKILQDIS